MSEPLQIEDILKPFWFKDINQELINKCYEFLDIYYFENKPVKNISKDFINFQKIHKKEFYKQIFKFGYLLCLYKMARYDNKYPNPHKELEKALRVKNVRENSGVMVYSIFTSGYPSYTRINPDGTTEMIKEFSEENNGNPGAFSCKYDCYYCPNFFNIFIL